ncbi:Rz1-like lysis system protein LysC [Achromobacter aegrifaciens]|uniref:Rz1-like lysis system protein LysC n=1 Tax=Achromobacter aegrifaciens TaxID=1287736 RepID=UPI003F88B201
MAGCAQPTKPSTRPTLPVNLSAPCPPVPRVDSPSWDDLAQAHVALAFQYAECAARHQTVVDAWARP